VVERRRLPDRRKCETIAFEHGGLKYAVTMGYFPDGSVGEIFLNTDGKAGSAADVSASDAALAVSLALQYGCPLEVIRSSVKRNADGSPQGPLAAALDKV